MGQFGYGRRACPGKNVATNSVWITVVSILASMDITKAVDEHGSIIEPSGEMKGSMLQCVYPTSAAAALKLTSTLSVLLSLSNAVSNHALQRSPAQSSRKFNYSGLITNNTTTDRLSSQIEPVSYMLSLSVIVMRALYQPVGSKPARANWPNTTSL